MKESAMSVPLDSLVGEVHLIGGARQAATPATGVFTAPRRAARGRLDDMLYVLIDLLGDVSSADLQTLMDQIIHAYWSTQGSVTSALRAALNSSASWLMDHNTVAPLPERLTGGVVCAVLRGSDIYLAQAGPTGAFIVHEQALTRYPSFEADPLPPIGTTRAIEVRFAHAQLKAGDTALLADARFGRQAPLTAIGAALTQVSVEKALENLEHLVGKGDLIALVLQATPIETAPKPATAAATAAAAATTAVAGAAIANASSSPQPLTPVKAPPAAAPVLPESAAETSAPKKPEGPVIHIAGRPSSAATSTASAAPAPASTTAPATPPPAGPPAAAPRTGAASEWGLALKQGLRRGAASVGAAGRIVADRTAPSSAQAKPTALTRNQTLVMLAIVIAIPVIIALLVAAVYTQRSAQEAVLSHIATAQNEITFATQAVTGGETRQHYAKAVTEAKLALQLEPGNSAAAQAQAQAQAELDKIDNVMSLTPSTLWDFKSVGQQHLISQGFSLFVLDRTANQVNRSILNTAGDKLEGSPEPILVPGMTVNNEKPGNLIDFTSMASSVNSQANDVIIGHDKGLVEYNLSFGLQTLPFGANTLAPSVKRIRSFDGKLYVLDPAKQQILKYEPTGNGYPNAPTSYLGQARPELAKALDMAIDGNIYVVLSDGKLLKFTDGQPAPFEVHGLGDPLRQPTLIAIDQNAQDSAVYVFDAASQRIVQLRPDGLFVRQFRADGAAFDNLQDLLIDEQNARLYTISQGVLQTAPLPALR